MRSGASPILAVLSSLFLLSNHGLVVAQVPNVTGPSCSSDAVWQWSYNSLGQNPCLVWGYMMSTCFGGQFTVYSLSPGHYYVGPDSTTDANNLCYCDTVSYNLLIACAACQGGDLTTWSQYTQNCTKTLPPSTFPNPVPDGTRVPRWALIDITNVNLFNSTAAQAVGDTPESVPGQLINGAPLTTTSPTSSSTSPVSTSTSTSTSHTPVPTSSSHSNVGAIAGGVAGGALALAVIAGLVLFFMRKRAARRQVPPPPESVTFISKDRSPLHSPPPSTASPMSQYDPRPVQPLTLYNPNDPSTFPRSQGIATPAPNVNVPVVAYSESLGRTDSATLQPQGSGYHGLPTV